MLEVHLRFPALELTLLSVLPASLLPFFAWSGLYDSFLNLGLSRAQIKRPDPISGDIDRQMSIASLLGPPLPFQANLTIP